MEQTRLLMGMPINVKILDSNVTENIFTKVYSYFDYIDQKFSTYKSTSEISAINAGKLSVADYSPNMQEVFDLCKQTKAETDGYFDIYNNGKVDPSGLVKGWSIFNAANIIKDAGFNNFYIDAGGDIQTSGKNEKGKTWSVGIKDPFDQTKIVKVIYASDMGIATSGTYIRGQHIYNPKNKKQNKIEEIVSLTVIGPNIYEADRFATAAFVMERNGIKFIESLPGFEGYMIDKNGIATYTSGFEEFTKEI